MSEHAHSSAHSGAHPSAKHGFATGFRTHTCGALRASDAGQTVTLSGWVHSVRDQGGVKFFDVRDRYGRTQVTVSPQDQAALAELVNGLHREDVVQVTGAVNARVAANAKLPTGEIEVIASSITVLARAATPPFEIDDHGSID
jgi:aspartyl-tRNA synthetase